MKIINFFKKKEYLLGSILIFLDINTFLFFYDFCTLNKLLIIFIINMSIIMIHLLICIFLESEFSSNYLRILQLRFEGKISIFSLIAAVSTYLNIYVMYYFYNEYLKYKNNCPFNLSEFDYKLHLKRRCELFSNTSIENNISQYICSFNAEKNYRRLEHLNDQNIYSEYNCSLVETLMNNNGVIVNFVNEYNKEDIYYCDLKNQPLKYPDSIDNYFCQVPLPLIYVIIFFSQIILSFYYTLLNHLYFRNIRANVCAKKEILY